jgi:SAM-dependent methyltransferase
MQIYEDPQHRLWSRAFSGVEYYYGYEPGPVARRAVRYHAPGARPGATALDAGCGEGQDVALLAERGYRATGVEFTETGIEKARQLLRSRGLQAELIHADLRDLDADERLRDRQFDMVLAVNALQFMGADGSACLDRLRERVKPGGVIGLSLWAREAGYANIENGVWLVTLEEVMTRFPGWRMLEAANLWQWNPGSDVPLAFVTLVARAPLSG